MLDFHVKARDETLESGAERPSLGRPAWPYLHVSPPSRGMILIASGGRSFRLFAQPSFFGPGGLLGAGWPTSGSLSVFCCTDTLFSGHGSIWDGVDVVCLIMAQVSFSFGYGFKPSGSKLYIFGSVPLEWLEFSL